MVIWLLGLSGAGKTTLGIKLAQYLKEEKKLPVAVLDGDEVRRFFDNDLGYSIDERKANIKRIILTAYYLHKYGHTVIVCNISPFEDLRLLCRKKIAPYFQVYLMNTVEECKEKDTKNVYNNSQNDAVVGVDLRFEEPLNNDLVIDTSKGTVDDNFQLLTHAILEIVDK